MKNQVVLFTKNNARIIKTDDFSPYLGNASARINPDLSQVKRIPPHFWKINQKGEIVEMTPLEKEIRLKDHKKNGVDNQIPSTQMRKIPLQLYHHRLFYIGCGASLGLIMEVIIRLMKG